MKLVFEFERLVPHLIDEFTKNTHPVFNERESSDFSHK